MQTTLTPRSGLDTPPEVDDLIEATQAGVATLILGALPRTALRAAMIAHAHLPPLTEQEARWIAAEQDAARGVRPRVSAADHQTADCVTPAAVSRPFRAPHADVALGHLVGRLARVHHVQCTAQRCVCDLDELRGRGGHVIRRASELDHARFGTIFLAEVADFSTGTVVEIGRRLRAWPVGAGRPRLIVSAGRCLCLAGWGAQVPCTCNEDRSMRAMARVRGFCDLLGVTVRVTLPGEF